MKVFIAGADFPGEFVTEAPGRDIHLNTYPGEGWLLPLRRQMDYGDSFTG
jgi:hypothetical protein